MATRIDSLRRSSRRGERRDIYIFLIALMLGIIIGALLFAVDDALNSIPTYF